LKPGTVISYSAPYEEKSYVGMITKKASSGYWVLWCDGSHKIIPKSLLKNTKVEG
tara:strand:+ start:63 stop:227 length:165 start_codon:yes stop_codon:yes gene_type:complete